VETRASAVLHRSVRDLLRDLTGGARRFWLLVGVTGVVAGLGAVLLVALLRVVQELVWPPSEAFIDATMAASPTYRLLVLIAAGALVSIAALLSRRSIGGHGTAGIIEAIWVKAGKLSMLRAIGRGVLSIVVVGMGAPLGREGALQQVGAAAGSFFGRQLATEPEEKRLLVACGAAAGIAAAYNVPIGGALFGLEVLLGSFALELFGPIVVACVTATLISRILIANHPSYVIPAYALNRPREIALALALAPLLGIASAIYVRVVDLLARLADRVPSRWGAVLPTASLALCGLIAMRFPEILGNGYYAVSSALLGKISLEMLFGLPVLKLVVTGTAAAGGVPGGMFTPSLFYGALLGGAFGAILERQWPSLPSGVFALVGMGAVLAGTTHAAVSAVLIIFELTGEYGVILPLMLTCVVAAGVSRWLEPESLYTAALLRRRVRLPAPYRPDWVRNARIAALLMPEAAIVSADAPFRKVMLSLLALPPGRDLYVVSADGAYAGTIVLDQMKQHLPDERWLDVVVAADVMESVVPLTGDMLLSDAAARFSDTYLDKLPVVHPATRDILGVVSKGDVLRQGRF
jgi:CIC family chloride channel protein